MTKTLCVCLILLLAGCGDHHDLAQCKGPYVALKPPMPDPGPPTTTAPRATAPAIPAPVNLRTTMTDTH